ncbi:hypothetical protein T492DRAFT_996589 [Pavlovales sp. CCMP2436]|nr:hypothetical protein T492DRAFT_996589 [Pavlovales sp. CCMP2436]
MHSAIALIFGDGTVHFFCLYHIYTNLFKHMSKLFGADRLAWRAFVNRFWRIAKLSDICTRENFATEWAELTTLAQASTHCDEKTRTLAFEWLRVLGTRSERYCARWTWAHLTLDVHSTQRAEAIHSALCEIISASDKLAKLLEKLSEFEKIRFVRKFISAHRRVLTQDAGACVSIVVRDELAKILVPEALEHVPISQREYRVTYIAPPQAAPRAVGSSSAEGRKAGAAVGSGPLPGVLDVVDDAVLLADHGLNQQLCSVTHVASLRKCEEVIDKLVAHMLKFKDLAPKGTHGSAPSLRRALALVVTLTLISLTRRACMCFAVQVRKSAPTR